jgi:hypothetical protein
MTQEETVPLTWMICNKYHFYREGIKTQLFDKIVSWKMDQSMMKATMDCGRRKGSDRQGWGYGFVQGLVGPTQCLSLFMCFVAVLSFCCLFIIVTVHCRPFSVVGCHIADGNMAPASCVKKKNGRGSSVCRLGCIDQKKTRNWSGHNRKKLDHWLRLLHFRSSTSCWLPHFQNFQNWQKTSCNWL